MLQQEFLLTLPFPLLLHRNSTLYRSLPFYTLFPLYVSFPFYICLSRKHFSNISEIPSSTTLCYTKSSKAELTLVTSPNLSISSSATLYTSLPLSTSPYPSLNLPLHIYISHTYLPQLTNFLHSILIVFPSADSVKFPL